jgi:hypothetical protein
VITVHGVYVVGRIRDSKHKITYIMVQTKKLIAVKDPADDYMAEAGPPTI